MLVALTILVALAAATLLLIFLRKRSNIIYRRRASDGHRGYSVTDHPATSGFAQHAWSAPDEPTVHSHDGGLAWGGGEFGGSGAGESYDAGSEAGQSNTADPSMDDSSGCSVGDDTNVW